MKRSSRILAWFSTAFLAAITLLYAAHVIFTGSWSLDIRLFGRSYVIGTPSPAVPGEPEWRAQVFKKNPDISDVFVVVEGYAGFRDTRSGKFGFVDSNGNVTIPAKFGMIWDFRFGRAMVMMEGGTAQIDTRGAILFGPDHDVDMISVIDPNRSEVKYWNGTSIQIDATGKPVPPSSQAKNP